ncbi:hypothetical protein HDE68_000194 [Pedobacter cryoconitis]|uniref:Carboxypeptidase-like protein n=1 Tax=Pedobacter cryoconitis TaxID=188932 RepID=A0A7W8ZHT3_9SPHI|nr:hypothetical protein [Pedobacter cryoconitis]MBB5634309.1 hypothetical protein [Pedobacter cryoconitis]
MRRNYKQILLTGIFILQFIIVKAQAQQMLKGVIFEEGTKSRLGNVPVYNKRTGYTNTSNNFGLFDILAQEGDTLQISMDGYINKELRVSNLNDLIIYLRVASNQLKEVKITSQSLLQNLKENRAAFRDKGIFYGGKPSAGLLSPLGGSPLTFLYESFSQDGKRARRLDKFIARESDYTEVASRFNKEKIKMLVPVKEEDMEEFKAAYWPKNEEIRKWSDYDLHNYIRKSFEEFKKTKGNM